MQESIRTAQRGYVDVSADPIEETSDFNFSEDMNADDGLRSEAKDLIHRIYEHTPDGSVIRGTLKKVKNGYKGVLKICHDGGQMIAEGINKSADETLALLESQIWGKIKKWRKTRFKDEPRESFKIA